MKIDKRILLWVGIAVLMVSTGLWSRGCGRESERIAQQEVRTAAVNAAVATWRAQYDSVVAGRRALADSLAAARAQQTAGAAQTAQAASHVETVLQAVAVIDPVLADSLQRAITVERTGFQIQIAALQHQVRLLTGAVDSTNALLDQAQMRIADLITDRDQWRDLRTPSRFRCVAGPGAAAGWGGVAAGAAVTCGLTL